VIAMRKAMFVMLAMAVVFSSAALAYRTLDADVSSKASEDGRNLLECRYGTCEYACQTDLLYIEGDSHTKCRPVKDALKKYPGTGLWHRSWRANANSGTVSGSVSDYDPTVTRQRVPPQVRDQPALESLWY
jgi:hypothetical protein